MKNYIAIDERITGTKIKLYHNKKEAKKDKNFFYDILIKGKVLEGKWKIK